MVGGDERHADINFQSETPTSNVLVQRKAVSARIRPSDASRKQPPGNQP
jgi:hypothetical protein